MDRAPFSFGPSGQWLTSSDRHEVFVCSAGDAELAHVIPLDAAVTAIRNLSSLVLAVDERGTLYGLDPSTGTQTWAVSLGRAAHELVANESGRWVVVHSQGLSWGDLDAVGGELELPNAMFAALAPDGQTVALATTAGEFTVIALGRAPGRRVELGHDATGLAYSALGWWLVSTTRGIFRIPVDGGEPELFLKWGGEDPPARVACSTDGRLCAFAAGPNAVAVFGVEYDINCGAVVYHDREVGDVEFGPTPWLGIGIGRGDGNKIDLLGQGVHRTDPPTGRPTNRWTVQHGVDGEEVAKVLGQSNPAASSDGPDLEAVGRFVEDVLLEPMKAVRVLSIIGFVLCAIVVAILLSVMVSGAEGSDDVGVPFAVAGFLTAALGISMVVRSKKVQDIRRLGKGLRERDRSVVREALPVTIIGEGEGLEFILHGNLRRFSVPLDDGSRAAVLGWLAT